MTSKTLLLIQKADTLDYRVSLAANRILNYAAWQRFFHIISRMGDGIFWYVLILSLPLLLPDGGFTLAICVTLMGLMNLGVYRRLKARFARPRPYAMYPEIRRGTRVLDEYSFPSGHTLHAVTFTLILVAFAPWLGGVLVPFALLTALSRVVLGVHFMSDVLAAAALGILHGMLAVAVIRNLSLV